MDLPLLYPTPRNLERLAGTVPADAPVRRSLDPAIAGDEAYRLVIRDGAVTATARTATGLRWADATLAQIRAQCPRELPCLAIDDAPAFAHRGFMLDISRDRVPTLKTAMELVDAIAALKGNRLQLYTEHTIAYRGHEDAWRGSSPLTLEELRALDAYAASKGVALDANQNCLGHVERWLKHPRYAPLGEMDRGYFYRAWQCWVQPNTLCPTDPKALEFVRDLLAQQLPAVSGAYANIGCDEPLDLGQGRSKPTCDAEGRGKVFSRWVSQVAEIARDLGKKPMYWCDPHPHEDDGLPRDLIALVWGYDPKTDFATRTTAHRAVGRPVWVAPGTGNWNSTTGRTDYRRANLAVAAAERRAEGYLNTEWGDSGHLQPWPTTLAGMADGMQAAWTGGGTFDDAALGAAVFGDAAVGRWLGELGNADAELTKQVGNGNALHADMRMNTFDPSGKGTVDEWKALAARLAVLEASRPASGPWAAECAWAVRSAQWMADRAVQRRSGITLAQRQDLAARLGDVLHDHRTQWLARCGYGGLEDSCLQLRRHAVWY